MTKQQKIKTLALATLLAVTAGGGYYWSTHRYLESTDNAYVKADLTPLTAKVQANVKDIKVADNQVVKRGDVLLELDDRDYAVQVQQLEAQVASRQAALAVLQSKLGAQHAQIDQAAAQAVAAGADATRAGNDAERFSALLKDQYTTAQRAEAAKADAIKAKANVAASSARVQAEEDQLKGLAAQVEQAHADLAQAQAALTQAQNSRADTVITAPVDGVVGNRGAQVGELVKPGSQLLVLMQPSSLYVQANFKETQVTHMAPGKTVKMHVDAFPDVQFTGVVDSLSPASGAQFSLLPQDNATGNFTKIVQRIPVKIRLTGPQNYQTLLKPGMSVVADVDLR